jgi:transcription-repair coupling factor (superfamily II helicase)
MRFGQVFFVHNRVENIYEVASLINKLVPDANIAVAHGQQQGDKLERTMLKFIDGHYDVLVSTNIIESGLDIPNANTIIINQAHMFGLSDLHQMRGRVGRSNKKAFCYLLSPKISSLTSDAKKRLIVLEEFSGLGDGLNIALKDLDIRGAGNLLGGEQSGFINELGFETYNKILDEALSDVEQNNNHLKRNEIKKLRTTINCLVDPYEKAIIPKAYIQNSEERLRVYGFIEEMSKKGSFKQIKSNLKDRFGPLPLEVRDLIRCMKVKRLGANLNVDKITIKKDVLKLVFFKSRSEKEKNNTFGLLLKLFNKEGHKYAITEKNNQIIISVLGYLNLEKTLNLLKKIKV